MKKFATLSVCILLCLEVFAQQPGCNFLEHFKFKNGIDTIVIKATFLDLLEAPPPLVSMVDFNRKQKLSNSELAFRPAGCPMQYTAPIKYFQDKAGLLRGDNLGLSIWVTCVVFEKYLHVYGESPFFIVINAVPQKPVGRGSAATGSDTVQIPGFLSGVHFKNGIYTVNVKAIFHATYRQDHSLILNALYKNGIIKTNKLNYQIGFTLANSAIQFMAPVYLNNDSLVKLPDTKDGQAIYLTCIVFDKYYIFGRPYFIIDKWHF